MIHTALKLLITDRKAFREKASARLRRIFYQDLCQYFWFINPVPAERIGYGSGPLTLLRRIRSLLARRPVRICLVHFSDRGPLFGPLTEHWINRRSSLCRASLNRDLRRADIIWTYMQDPISEAEHSRLLGLLERAKPGARVINHPDRYNVYHREDTFARLENAGVNVPRSRFGEGDIGVTPVVYKRSGEQASHKVMGTYEGEKEGMRAFEYIDARDGDGMHRRYRAYYILGLVWPSKLQVSPHWNVCLKHSVRVEETFTMTPGEIRQVRLLAKETGLDYFAVDYVRRHGDGKPYFLDINIYPTIFSIAATLEKHSLLGQWHIFDTREMLGMSEPGGYPFPESFDRAVRRFLKGNTIPVDEAAYDLPD